MNRPIRACLVCLLAAWAGCGPGQPAVVSPALDGFWHVTRMSRNGEPAVSPAQIVHCRGNQVRYQPEGGVFTPDMGFHVDGNRIVMDDQRGSYEILKLSEQELILLEAVKDAEGNPMAVLSYLQRLDENSEMVQAALAATDLSRGDGGGQRPPPPHSSVPSRPASDER